MNLWNTPLVIVFEIPTAWFICIWNKLCVITMV